MALTLALVACGSNGSSLPPQATTAAVFGPPRLLFEDDFTGTKLDTKKWFWCYPYGSADNCTNGQSGIPYREREQYRRTQLLVSGGQLHLIAVHHSVKPHFAWTSGMVTTGGPFERRAPHPTFAFKYGFAEIRAKLPAGHGFWPAFWLLPASGAWPPEIDVMEEQGAQPHRDYMTVHFSTPRKLDDSIGGSFDGPNLAMGFHTYAIDWQPTSLTWYLDGTPRFVVTAQQIEARHGKFPSTPMYVLMNLALGGWVSPPNKHTPSPASMTIDYIRIWDRRP
ncbi:MAG: glycoside hydrolase family 16 protein [Candidatus Eremiobacteraeota bacterium]|nr:glycoside hydrolase family 16 protein [Candidatus Eremiobacteraeota bacterium]